MVMLTFFIFLPDFALDKLTPLGYSSRMSRKG